MALDAGKTIIVEFAASKKNRNKLVYFGDASMTEYLSSYVSFSLATAHLWMS